MKSKFRIVRTLFAAVALALAVANPLSTVIPAHAAGLAVTDLNNGATPAAMANMLVGSGVTVSNVTYTGANRAAGTFSGGATIFGFDNGIILDSGKVQTYSTDPPCSRGVEGPNTCYESWDVPAPGGGPGPSGEENSTAFNTPGDPQLSALSGFTTYDASILQFDFVPQFPTVQFQYVFSSEEYSDYSNTQFNDVFAFFVNGTNCALTPDNKPVSVNTINNGNDQLGGDPTPHNPLLFRDNVRPTPTINIQMDGLTTTLTCTATVNAGQTNHMKLAIADASDAIFDSAVFLKGGSLISGTQVTTSLKGGGQSGPIITVPQGTAVTDSATLIGANASSATGTVTYTVYSNATCTTQFASGGTKAVSNGVVPDSDPVTMSQPGTFYWIAAYSGDAFNNPSSNACGSEVVTVTPAADPPITGQGLTLSATEGQSFSGTVATVSDGDPMDKAAEYAATIDWGDGSTSPGTMIGNDGTPTGGPPYSVKGAHTYAEEGAYTIKVHVTDSDSTNSADATSTANVSDAPLTSMCAAPPVITQAYAGPTATFNDSSASGTPNDFSASIAWGDGSSSPGTIAGGPGLAPYTVSGNHTYGSTGAFTITTTITDVGGSKTTATCQVSVGAFPTANGGTFVVGDLEATGIGAPLTWWSSQWAIINQMSGGPAPSSMKGFAGFEDMPLPSPIPPLNKLCGMNWTTDTGNATPPPPSVPSDMFVIVSSHITQNGSVVSGDIKELILVHNNPGYQPDPGHDGTGTEEAIACVSP